MHGHGGKIVISSRSSISLVSFGEMRWDPYWIWTWGGHSGLTRADVGSPWRTQTCYVGVCVCVCLYIYTYIRKKRDPSCGEDYCPNTDSISSYYRRRSPCARQRLTLKNPRLSRTLKRQTERETYFHGRKRKRKRKREGDTGILHILCFRQFPLQENEKAGGNSPTWRQLFFFFFRIVISTVQYKLYIKCSYKYKKNYKRMVH